MSTFQERAAIVIRTELGKGARDIHQLRAALAKAKMPGAYAPYGIRYIRDHFGADALVKVRLAGRRVVYKLNPNEDELRTDANEGIRRMFAEIQTNLHFLDYAAAQWGNRGSIRYTRRYLGYAHDELADLVDNPL